MALEFDLFTGLIPHEWRPDETLYSLCSRHHFLSQNFKASSTCIQLFGRAQKGLAHDLPSRVGHFCKITHDQLGSAQDVVQKRTLLPFYLAFADVQMARYAIESMIGDSIGSLKFNLGILTSGFRANHPLKVCRTCMSLDRQNFSTPYWHLNHQFPGVAICHLHGDLLQYSNLKATGVGRFQWTLPSENHLDEPVIWTNPPPAAKSIATLTDKITKIHCHDPLDHSRLASAYRIRLFEMGLTHGASHRLQAEIIGKRYADFLFPMLQHYEFQGLPNNQKSAFDEVKRLTSGRNVVRHPLRHIALIAWLFDSLSDLKRIYDRLESLSMDQAEKSARFKVLKSSPVNETKEKFLLAIQQGTAISTASRNLGLDPATGMAWASSIGVTVNHRPSKLNIEKRKSIVSSLFAGDSKAAVAARAEVSESSINRILSTEPGLQAQWKDAVYRKARAANRAAWKIAIERNPNSGINGNRILESSAYTWLYRNDTDWLKEQNASLPHLQRNPKPRVNWDSRDQGLAMQVKNTSLLIAQESSGKRIKLWQIYQRIPELKAKLGNLDKLPLTQDAIRVALSAYSDEREKLLV